ncbi:MAG TPA: hypothetical protein PK350_04990 [Deltaproteobacteria bacterium]|nr:hypothetical protein [Deltaproteobacteria bacterium]
MLKGSYLFRIVLFFHDEVNTGKGLEGHSIVMRSFMMKRWLIIVAVIELMIMPEYLWAMTIPFLA